MKLKLLLEKPGEASMTDWNEIFIYDDGMLRWKIKPSKKVCIGSIAGWDDGKGYLRFVYLGKTYRVHNVIYEMFYGSIPEGMEIDHINRVRSDNRYFNLRKVSRSDNCFNQNIRKNNSTGFTGVYNVSRKNRVAWMAKICVNRKMIHLGIFDTLKEAVAARNNASIKRELEMSGLK